MLQVVGPAVFVAVGLAMVRFGDVSAIAFGWLAVLFFGFCLLVGVWGLVRRPTILTVDERGVTSPRGGFEFHWADVTGVYVVEQHTNGTTHTHVALDGRPVRSRTLMRRLGGINARLVRIPATASAGMVTWAPGTRPTLDDALAAIRAAAPQVPIRDRRR